MKILHVGKYYPPYHGGMETYLQDLSRELAHQGHHVSVIVHNHKHGLLYSPTINTSDGDVTIIRQSALRPFLFTPLMLRLGKTLKRLFKRSPPDLIHISWPNPSALFLLLNKKAKSVPWILQWHSDMVTEQSSWLLKLAYRFFRPFEKKMIRRCQIIVTSTQAYAQHSPALKDVLHKVRTIPIGINTDSIEKARSQSDQTTELFSPAFGLKIFTLGRLTFYKNHQLLLQAMQHHPDWQLVITGQGPEYKKLQQTIQKLGLRERVVLTGALPDDQVHALYQNCDVFCLPSNDRAESYGLVLLEAMAHNCIVVAPDTQGSGMQWLAEQYDKGFVFKSNDSDSLAKTLEDIQNNQENIQQHSSNFKLRIDHTSQLNEALYTEIVAVKKKSSGIPD